MVACNVQEKYGSTFKAVPFCHGLAKKPSFPDGSVVKNLSAMQETQVQSLGQENPLEEESTPVFMPGECQGQRSQAAYSPLGRTEWDTAEVTKEQQQQLESYHIFFTNSCKNS